MAAFKIVAFDMDGTLANTFPIIFKSFERTVKTYTGEDVNDQTIHETFGLNEQGMLKELIPNYSPNALQTFYEDYADEHKKLTKPFDGIYELLDNLHHAKVITPLVTGKGTVSAQISLKSLGLKNYLSPVLTGSPAGPNKDKNFERLISQYKIKPSEMVYIGDTVGDYKLSKKAGIECYSAGWAPSTKVEDIKAVNPHVFMTIKDLQEALLK
mgnify:CR=1 FL=1